MIHLVLWICIVSSMVLLTASALGSMTYHRFKVTWFRYSLIFLAGITSGILIYLYQYFTFVYVTSVNRLLDLSVYLLNLLIQLLVLYVFPIALSCCLGKEIVKKRKIFIAGIAIVSGILHLLVFSGIGFSPIIRKLFLANHLLISWLYLLIALKNFVPFRKEKRKTHLASFIILAALFYPILFIDAIFLNFSLSSQKYIPDGMISFPVFGIFIGLFAITGTLRIQRTPGDLSSISPDFLRVFTITNREKEIIQHLMKGYSSGTISDELSISRRTVDTHITNIYRKCGVRNRVELVNLIKGI